MSMYSRSLSERVKIKFEIYYENLLDFVGHSALRKPLFIFVCLAGFMSFKSSQHSISSLKRSYMPSFKTKWSSSNQFSSYGNTASTYGNSLGGGSTGIAPRGMGVSQSSYGASAYGATNSVPGIGTRPASTPFQQQPGTMSNTLPTSSFNTNLRGAQSPAASFSTSSLVDQYGAQVQVVQGGIFHDYGMTTQFMGQIETITAIESPTFVQQTLSSPGNGKVLVVDGGASFNGAVFDSTVASTAQRNGWKGIIINGVVRDAEQLKTVQFGVKAMGAHPSPGQQPTGQSGNPLSFGGISFTPGSWVYADKDGIVVSQTSLNVGGGMTNPSAIAPGMPRSSVGGGMTTGGITSNGIGSTNQMNSYGTGSMGTGSTGTVGSSYTTPQQQYQPPRTNTYGMQQQQQQIPQQRTPTGALGNSYQQPGQMSSQYQPSAPRPASQGGLSSRFSNNRSQYSANNSPYGQKIRKKPSKRTLVGLLLLVCAIAWFCLGD